jgi:radical SAM superfamily enzyme YgiQ (UPF0313 family)
LKAKTTIYLANLVNNKFGASPSDVPLSIGFLKAYVMSQFADQVEIKLFKTFDTLFEAIQEEEPAILGCSWYIWNEYLTTNALEYIKERYPNIITVLGAANVPESAEDCLRDLKKFHCIDVLIPNEGEIPFNNLVKVYLEGGRKAIFEKELDGAFYLSASGEEVVAGKVLPRMEDLNIIPSPYLTGYLDEFISQPEAVAGLQTSRGCPYLCTFCNSAKESWSRIRAFDVDRVKEEIDYLERKAANWTLRFTDENFGILPRDLELAKYIAEKRKKTGYPNGLRTYTAKNINDNTKNICLLLKDLIPLNMSCQTMTDPVLENIKRANIKLDKYPQLVRWAHANNVNATSELIFGLPGETYKSFMEVIHKLVELRFDSVAMGTLSMLKETPMVTPETIDKYKYKILYGPAERAYTRYNEFESVEIHAWAVENNSFSFDEYVRIRQFISLYNLFMYCGYFKEMIYIWENRGVKIGNVITEILVNSSKYPFIGGHIEELKRCVTDNLFETKEQVYADYKKRVTADDNSAERYFGDLNPFSLSMIVKGNLIHTSGQDKTIDEAVKASLEIFKKEGKGELSEFLKELELGKEIVKSCVVPFWEQPLEMVSFMSPYDITAWKGNDFRGVLTGYALPEPRKFEMKVSSIEQYRDFIVLNAERPLSSQAQNFYRNFRSNNIRRQMVHSQSQKEGEGNVEELGVLAKSNSSAQKVLLK